MKLNFYLISEHQGSQFLSISISYVGVFFPLQREKERERKKGGRGGGKELFILA